MGAGDGLSRPMPEPVPPSRSHGAVERQQERSKDEAEGERMGVYDVQEATRQSGADPCVREVREHDVGRWAPTEIEELWMRSCEWLEHRREALAPPPLDRVDASHVNAECNAPLEVARSSQLWHREFSVWRCPQLGGNRVAAAQV
jgi:hypothetical protein